MLQNEKNQIREGVIWNVEGKRPNNEIDIELSTLLHDPTRWILFLMNVIDIEALPLD